MRGREPVAGDRSGRGYTQPLGTNRNVSVAPSRARTDRGMAVVNRGDARPGPNRTGPVSRQGYNYRVTPQAAGPGPAIARYQSGPSRVVAPTNNKAGRAHTGIPARSRNPAPAVRVNPGQAVAQSGPAAPRVAPPQRSYREPAAPSNRNYSSPDRQAPRDSGNDGGRSQWNSDDRGGGGRGDGGRGDGGWRRGH